MRRAITIGCPTGRASIGFASLDMKTARARWRGGDGITVWNSSEDLVWTNEGRHGGLASNVTLVEYGLCFLAHRTGRGKNKPSGADVCDDAAQTGAALQVRADSPGGTMPVSVNQL